MPMDSRFPRAQIANTVANIRLALLIRSMQPSSPLLGQLQSRIKCWLLTTIGTGNRGLLSFTEAIEANFQIGQLLAIAK